MPTFHLRGSEGHPPPFPPPEQQIVKSVDSLDRLAKKADVMMEVVARSLKVTPPSETEPRLQSDMLMVNVARHTVKTRGAQGDGEWGTRSEEM